MAAPRYAPPHQASGCNYTKTSMIPLRKSLVTFMPELICLHHYSRTCCLLFSSCSRLFWWCSCLLSHLFCVFSKKKDVKYQSHNVSYNWNKWFHLSQNPIQIPRVLFNWQIWFPTPEMHPTCHLPMHKFSNNARIRRCSPVFFYHVRAVSREGWLRSISYGNLVVIVIWQQWRGPAESVIQAPWWKWAPDGTRPEHGDIAQGEPLQINTADNAICGTAREMRNIVL